MLKSKLGVFYIVVFLLFVSYIIYRQSSYYIKLAVTEGRLTVAHVYSKDRGSKGSIFYNYIYQVRSDFYTTSTTGSHVEFIDSISPQYFVVSYNDNNSSIHTLLWSFKLTDSLDLGTRLDSKPISKELIRKHTVGLIAHCRSL